MHPDNGAAFLTAPIFPFSAPSVDGDAAARAPRSMTGPTTTRNLLIAWGVLTLLVAGFAAYDATRVRPTDGALWRLGGEEIRVVGLVDAGPAERAGIRVGDVIEGIDRQAIRDPRHASELLQSKAVGDEVPYLVRRDGEMSTTVLTLDRTRITSVTVYLVYCGLGIFYLVTGAYVFWRNPTLLPARLFYILCTLFLVYFFSASERSTIYYWADTFVQNAGTFASLMVPPLFLHFFLVFPMRRAVLDRHRWLIPALYAIPALYYLSFTHQQFFERQMASIGPAEQMTLGFYFVAALGSLVSIFLTSRDTTLRARVKFLTLGTVVGTLPFLVFNIALGKLLGREDFTLMGAIPMVLVPVSFGYTIARYRLMDLEVFIRRSLVFALLTGLVIGSYLVIVVLVGNVVLDVSGQNSQLVAIIATLLIAAAFAPARERIQGFLERRFFREKHDLQEALHDLSKAIPNTLETSALTTLVRERIGGLLHPTHLEFLPCIGDHLHFPNGDAMHPVPGLTRLVRRRSATLTPEVVAGELVRLSRGEDEVRLAQRRELEEDLVVARQNDLEILVPALAGDRLVGGLALGPKRSETAYDGAELEVLQIVAGQMGVQIENSRLYREAIERQRLEEELAVARSIQQRLLPSETPLLEGFELAALNRASAQVSGDYYDFVHLEGKCGLVIADVSGKGLPASLLASNLQASIRALVRHVDRPGAIMEAVNTSLYESTDPERFATAFMAGLDADAGTLNYSNAGHNPPLLRRANGTVEWLDVGATPLGAFPGMAYGEATVSLDPGDMLVMFTDGITEAEDADGEFFGETGLERVVEECCGRDAEAVVECIRQAVHAHSNGIASDDMTLIVVRRLQGQAGNGNATGT